VAVSGKKAVAELALACMEDPVKFAESQRAINTKSNLNFDVFKDIAAYWCLDMSSLLLRSNIGGRRPPSIVVSELCKMEGVLLNFVHDPVFIGYATGPVSG
jgi:hypothetical protein